MVSTDHLRDNLKYYTSSTHVAGTNDTQGAYTRDYFLRQGIDAKIVEYYPWMNHPLDQKVLLFNATTHEVLFEAGLTEDPVPGDPASYDPNNLPAFHGYSANGNITGQVVYANYGTFTDFKMLANAGINVEGKVVLMRYGSMLRGLQVHAAHTHGAIGALLYSDPADDGYAKGKVYPKGPWRPESSFQRGTVSLLQIYPGDPLTPGYPAKRDAPRIDPKDAKNINRIPSLPLSYRDAIPLLQALQGHGRNASEIDGDWVGGLTTKGIEYWTGPSILNVNLLNRVEYRTVPIQNVIGRIKGWEDPDHAVIIGNHRDAWCAGASDPSSGSAALLELARTFGELRKLGWRPRRSIILASWDAGENGLIGSTEWVEENVDWLRANAVGYINVNAAVGGDVFGAHASPVFRNLLYSVAKQIPCPGTNETMYDAWLRNSSNSTDYGDLARTRRPPIAPLALGSDYTAFMAHAGISSIDLGFSGSVGAYHSNYDSLVRMASFIDPDMKLHQTITRFWGLLALRLADDPVLGLNAASYAKDLNRYIRLLRRHISSFETPSSGQRVSDQSSNQEILSAKKLRHLHAAQKQLLASARVLERDKRHLRLVYGEGCQMKGHRRHESCLRLRESINDRSSQLERHFIDPEGIPGREWYKHSLVGPDRWTGYGSQVFPALAEAAEDKDWKRFQKYEKRVAELIYEAAWFLRDV
ncbi:Vacuolar protein sorting-associated protein 70 [Coemansia sp. Benny D160-2]|nr:Vacuolar protein sorting-associated protein 70 [Coemansia sp. Benny D160-2]